MNNKRGLSQVISTILLIAMVLIIGTVVFLWLKGMIGEKITKFDGENIELACGKVEFDVSYSGGTLYIVNTGNVAIYRMNLKISEYGSYTTEELSSGWPDDGLNPGAPFSGSISISDSATKITLIPVLRGNVEGRKKNFTCDERYGHEINIE